MQKFRTSWEFFFYNCSWKYSLSTCGRKQIKKSVKLLHINRHCEAQLSASHWLTESDGFPIRTLLSKVLRDSLFFSRLFCFFLNYRIFWKKTGISLATQKGSLVFGFSVWFWQSLLMKSSMNFSNGTNRAPYRAAVWLNLSSSCWLFNSLV